MKTNSGKIYSVAFTDNNEENSKTYVQNVYATCEAHAKQIFESYEQDCTILEITEEDSCISEHYDTRKALETDDTLLPEETAAHNIMYAILDEASKDKCITTENFDDVLDMALVLVRMAIKKALALDAQEHDEEEY